MTITEKTQNVITFILAGAVTWLFCDRYIGPPPPQPKPAEIRYVGQGPICDPGIQLGETLHLDPCKTSDNTYNSPHIWPAPTSTIPRKHKRRKHRSASCVAWKVNSATGTWTGPLYDSNGKIPACVFKHLSKIHCWVLDSGGSVKATPDCEITRITP